MSINAIFLDRDGTLIEDAGYLADPSGVALLPGVALALKKLKQAGYVLVVVSNQSGIARGLFDEAAVDAIHEEMSRQLAEHGAAVDAIYYCPCHPEGHVHPYACESEHRKPKPGMLLQAADELDIDLTQSWMIGDKPADVAAGKRAGCRTIRMEPREDTVIHAEPDLGDAKPDFVAGTFVEATQHVLQEMPDDEPPEQPTAAEEESCESNPPMPAPHFSLQKPDIHDAPDEASSDDDGAIRREILRHVRQMSMHAGRSEFSLAHVIGGVTQMLAIVLVVVVLYQALAGTDTAKATLWCLLALVFQTMSLTFFTMSKKK